VLRSVIGIAACPVCPPVQKTESVIVRSNANHSGVISTNTQDSYFFHVALPFKRPKKMGSQKNREIMLLGKRWAK
jgi:hypothetical protein